MRILAVDDDQIALDIIVATLSTAGYEHIETALSADEAHRKIEATDRNFDCVLLDIMMPGTNGVDLCRQIRHKTGYEHVPIIMITAVRDQSLLEAAIAAGATDYVNKPFHGLELGARLRAATILAGVLNMRANSRRHASGAVTGRRIRSDLKVGDAIELDETASIKSAKGFQTQLLPSRGKRQVSHVGKITVIDIDRVFKALPSKLFRPFLNEIARAIGESLSTLGGLVTYTGNGIFEFSIFDREILPGPTITEAIRNSISNSSYCTLASFKNYVSFRIELLKMDNGATGSDALRNLSGTWTGIQAPSAASLSDDRPCAQQALTTADTAIIQPFALEGAKKDEQSGAIPRVFPRRVRTNGAKKFHGASARPV